MRPVRLLFLGDTVGTPGVRALRRLVPLLRKRERLDCVIVNAENASGGAGLYPNNYKQLRGAGVDALTMGDHIYKRTEIYDILRNPEEPICKPANFPPEAPGRGHIVTKTPDGVPIAVISLLGRTFMRPVDCPFRAVDRELRLIGSEVRVIVVDIHAEATADKYLMLHHLKGRVSAVVGTHTHVATADEQIVEGTAFQCDVGMTGSLSGILGRKAEKVLPTALTFMPQSFDVADDNPCLNGALIEVDTTNGRALSIRRIRVAEADADHLAVE